MPTPPRRSQAERSRVTREALLTAARALFGEQGFAATGREQIVEQAGVTRGALYHHFPGGKTDLFRAVVEEMEAELTMKAVEAAMKESHPAAQLRKGAAAFLDSCLDPAVQRIVLLDARAVLGWDEWRAIESRYALSVIKQGLEEAAAVGIVEKKSVDSLAHLLLGALAEAAAVVATSAHPRAARREVARTLDLLLDRLLSSR